MNNNIYLSIQYYRLKFELDEFNKVISENQTEEVKSKWNLIGKASNSMKDSKAKKYEEKKTELEKKIAEFEEKNKDFNYNQYFDNTLENSINEEFKEDKYSLAKILFSMLLSLDDSYEYEYKEKELENISKFLFNDSEKIEKVNSNLRSHYNGILASLLQSVSFDNNTKELLNKVLDDSLSCNDIKNVKVETNVLSLITFMSLSFGKANIKEIYDANQMDETFIKADSKEIALALALNLVLLSYAKDTIESDAFKSALKDLLLVISSIKQIFYNELFVEKKDSKLNQSKISLFQRYDLELMKVFDL